MTGGVSGGMESRSQKWDNQAVEGTVVVDMQRRSEFCLAWGWVGYDVMDYLRCSGNSGYLIGLGGVAVVDLLCLSISCACRAFGRGWSGGCPGWWRGGGGHVLIVIV